MKMLKFKLKKDKRTALDKEIDFLLDELHEDDLDNDDYEELLRRIERLTEIRARETCQKKVEHVDPNTILVVLGAIVEIVLIMNYENLHVISTKAFGRVLRPKF